MFQPFSVLILIVIALICTVATPFILGFRTLIVEAESLDYKERLAKAFRQVNPSDLEYNSDCSICLRDWTSKLRVPVQLPCDHALCLSCKTRYFQESRFREYDHGIYRCPFCRRKLFDNKLIRYSIHPQGEFLEIQLDLYLDFNLLGAALQQSLRELKELSILLLFSLLLDILLLTYVESQNESCMVSFSLGRCVPKWFLNVSLADGVDEGRPATSCGYAL